MAQKLSPEAIKETRLAGGKRMVAAGMKSTGKPGSGSKNPGRDVVGQITMAQLRDIAKIKIKDMNTDDLDQATRTIAGSARSMGLQVKE